MSHIVTVPAAVTAAGFDREPTAAELDAIEVEMPLIRAQVDLLDAQIMVLDRPVTELDAQRLRRALRRVLAERRALSNRAAAAAGPVVA
ncbi:DUF6284 family protein [Streptomyces sp. NPDC018031]|uniref:DUF6284 family protein n=1 Tax=Streptomyces sp. NPDC018031 TaxID=3365033 RepID=UPI003796E441